VGNALKDFVAWRSSNLIMPFGVPLRGRPSAFRAWCFIPLTFVLAIHLVRSVRHGRAVFLADHHPGRDHGRVMACAQSPERNRAKMAEDAEFAPKVFQHLLFKLQGVRPSCACFPVVTAGRVWRTMAYCVMFAISRFSVAGNSWKERIIPAGLAAPWPTASC